MNFLNRNTLPKFQERLDLAASELNDMEEIYCESINELAGRIYIIANMIPEADRSKYAEETSCAILNKLTEIQTNITTLSSTIDDLKTSYDTQIATINSTLQDFETRLNELDDQCARKVDVNALWYRTGE